MAPGATDEPAVNRTRAALAVLPFLALGVGNVVLLLGWGMKPLWAFLIFPPILFISALAWIAFRTGFARDRGRDTGQERERGQGRPRDRAE